MKKQHKPKATNVQKLKIYIKQINVEETVKKTKANINYTVKK